jgi:hypothetical protein
LQSAATVVLSVFVVATLIWSVMIANWVILTWERRRTYVRHAPAGRLVVWTCS